MATTQYLLKATWGEDSEMVCEGSFLSVCSTVSAFQQNLPPNLKIEISEVKENTHG